MMEMYAGGGTNAVSVMLLMDGTMNGNSRENGQVVIFFLVV